MAAAELQMLHVLECLACVAAHRNSLPVAAAASVCQGLVQCLASFVLTVICMVYTLVKPAFACM